MPKESIIKRIIEIKQKIVICHILSNNILGCYMHTLKDTEVSFQKQDGIDFGLPSIN